MVVGLLKFWAPRAQFVPGGAATGSPGVGITEHNFYEISLVPLLVLTLILAWFALPSTSEVLPDGFKKFRFSYLFAWGLCVSADWLQGPYVYALYSGYGYTRHENAQLFVAGFASALVCGCFVGSLVDRYGRKRSSLAYCLLYILSCTTKHFNIYPILMLGRILGGAATALLFSCFECWMISEHTRRHGFSDGLLSYMFGLMYTLMYVVAMLSGFAAQAVANVGNLRPAWEGSTFHVGGALSPFDLAVVMLICGGSYIHIYWEENYGVTAEFLDSASVFQTWKNAFHLIRQDKRVWLLGIVVACFEGSMFSFVFNWTPALENRAVPPPLGLIFSGFMMACMCGSSLSTLLAGIIPRRSQVALCCLASVAAFFGALFATATNQLRLCFLSFLLFECMVGVYFPSVGVLKSEVVAENVRATVYNLYRVPLNAVVVVLLLTNLSLLRCYGLCASLLMVAFLCSAALRTGEKTAAKGAAVCGP